MLQITLFMGLNLFMITIQFVFQNEVGFIIRGCVFVLFCDLIKQPV